MVRRLPAKLLLAPLFALLVAGLAAPACAADAVTKTFDGWTATCNNLLSCVVLATASDDLFYVRIARDAGATAAPKVKLVLAAQEPLKGPQPAFRLVANSDGRKDALGPFPASAPDQDSSILEATLPEGAPSLAVIDAIRNAATLDYAVLATRGSLDLKGLAAALRFIDAQQGRQGTPSALVARGMTPIGQVPAPPAAPVVAAASSDGVSAIDKPAVPKAVADMATPVCDPEAVADQSEAQAWHLGPDVTLYALSCSQGAYNTVSALYLVAGDKAPKPVNLPRPAALKGDSADNVAENVGFDPKTMTLSSFGKGRGLGDCGTSASWLWDGHGFELLQASLLDACPGALPEDWPSIYAAQRKTQ